MLKLYNSLSKQLEDFTPTYPDHVNLYSCGPTVYNFAHIGNLRSFVAADVLYRTLKLAGYKPDWVMNITDVDDKTIRGTIAEFGPSAGVAELKQLTERYTKSFKEDLRELGVLVDEIRFFNITDYIQEIQTFVLELIEKGFAYKADDSSTYFSIEKYQEQFHDYGALVGEKFLEGKKIGARVNVDEYEKDNLSDFALWKAHDAQDGNIFWDHPTLGKGRPGWHIECSVINKVAFKGETTDIHTGGVDLKFPHHTNEIAQSQPVYKPFVSYWVHSEHLLVDGKKMSKSLGNFHTLHDLKERYQGKSEIVGQMLRYLFLQTHYRAQANFTLASLESTGAAIQGLLHRSASGKPESTPTDALGNDLNTAEALSVAAENPSDLGIDVEKIRAFETSELPGDVQALTNDRAAARTAKDFSKSDELRKKIESLGYEVLDTGTGQEVRRKL